MRDTATPARVAARPGGPEYPRSSPPWQAGGVRAEVADDLEAFVEAGDMWEPAALAAFVAHMQAIAKEDDDPLVARLGRFLEAVRLRQHVSEVEPVMRSEIEAVVYPRVWKVIEAIRADMPDGELRTRLEVMNRRLARLFVEETMSPSSNKGTMSPSSNKETMSPSSNKETQGT